MTRRKLLSLIDKNQVQRAIADAEAGTSAEIRVSIAGPFWGSPPRMADRAFARLGMARTSDRNAVLLFLAPWRRRVVIVADAAARERVDPAFWSETAAALGRAFADHRFSAGLAAAIAEIGREIGRHFPALSAANPNELSDALDAGQKPGRGDFERETPAMKRLKPPRGMGHYLRDFVYGALDGVITTLAVISAATGASFPPRVGLVLGLANLAADGLSMGASNYLGIRSELEQTGVSVATEMPWRHGLATSAAFVVVGSLPLLAYVLPRPPGTTVLQVSMVLAVMALGIAGGFRSRFTGKRVWQSAAEMMSIGMAATGAAYVVGALARRFLP